MAKSAVFMYAEGFETFDYGDYHPFKPYRARLVYEESLRQQLFDAQARVMEALPAEADELLRFHSAEFVETLRGANSGTTDSLMINYGLGTYDNPIFPGVFDFSLLALGATLGGAQQIISGEAQRAFNPVGGFHHAGVNHAEGFCYVNDICVAISMLQDAGYERILYLDIDAHHGNGVQDAYYESREVLTFSIHQNGHTLYPGTGFETEVGVGEGRGYCINLPLPEYTDDDAYVRAFRAIFPIIMERYDPQMIVAQIGLDILKRDPLTNLRCTNNGYYAVIRDLCAAHEKILALGGGGYSIEDAARGWTLAWSALGDVEPAMAEELIDRPHRISPGLKQGVDRLVDEKVSLLQNAVLPLLKR